MAHLEENMAAIDVELDEHDMAELEDAAEVGDPLTGGHHD